MKKRIIKRLIAVTMMVSCLTGLAFEADAAMRTNVHVYTSDGTYSYNTNNYLVNAGDHTCKFRTKDFSFIGLPSNVWPVNKYVHIKFKNSTVTRKYTSPATSYAQKVYSLSSQTYLYAGISSNYTNGVSANVDWDPVYY